MSNKFNLACQLPLDSGCSLTWGVGEDEEAGTGLGGEAGSVRAAVGVDRGSRWSPSSLEILGVRKCDSISTLLFFLYGFLSGKAN